MKTIKNTQAIVVIGGSFCPVHCGHLAALEEGRQHGARMGFDVVAGYLAAAHDGHVHAKLGDEALSSGVRLSICNAAAAATTWLRSTPKTFGSAAECAAWAVAEYHNPTTKTIIVRGSDREKPRKDKGNIIKLDIFRNTSSTHKAKGTEHCATQHLSSTLVRRQLKAEGFGAMANLVQRGLMPAAAAAAYERIMSVTPEPESTSDLGATLSAAAVQEEADEEVVQDEKDQKEAVETVATVNPTDEGEMEAARTSAGTAHTVARLAGASRGSHTFAGMTYDKMVFSGDWDDEGVFVYQAFSAEIAEYALEHQQLGGPKFNPSRMTWIKPSFAWVLYRSGFASKHGQERILKLKLPHASLAELLSQCACKHGGGGSRGRVQWDPARDLMTSDGRKPRRMLRERAIQIGLSRDLSIRYVKEVVAIEDVTALARRVGTAHQFKREVDMKQAMAELQPLLPAERPYMPSCEDDVLKRLCMK